MPETPDQPKTWKERGAEWLIQQGPTVAVLVAMLTVVSYGGWQALTVIIPGQIDKITTSHTEAVKSEASEHKEAVKALIESHDKDRQLYGELLRERRTMVGPLTTAKEIPGQ